MGQLIGPTLVGVTAHKNKKCQKSLQRKVRITNTDLEMKGTITICYEKRKPLPLFVNIFNAIAMELTQV